MSNQLLGCRDRYDHEMFPGRFRGYHSSSDEILSMLPKYAMYSSHKYKKKENKNSLYWRRSSYFLEGLFLEDTIHPLSSTGVGNNMRM